MLFEEICEVLDENQIGYHIHECQDGFKLIYIDHGNFGYPKGLKVKRSEFRPDLRISIHDNGRIYTRINGWTGYKTMEEILEIIKG